MRFFIDKNARKAYLFADTVIEEHSLKIIFAHLTGPFPDRVKLIEKQTQQGLQTIPMHIEMTDTLTRK